MRYPQSGQRDIAYRQVFIRQIIQHYSSQSLLSSDWTLASRMVGGRGQKPQCLSLNRRPALFPLFRLYLIHHSHGIQTKGSACKQSTAIKQLKEPISKIVSGIGNKRKISIQQENNNSKRHEKLQSLVEAQNTAAILCAIFMEDMRTFSFSVFPHGRTPSCQMNRR